MRIRQATLSDIPALVGMNRIVHAMHAAAVPRIFRKDPPDQMVADVFKAAIESSSSYWLLAENEEAVAFLSAEFRARAETWYMIPNQVCYLSEIVVAPCFRRNGVARALLAELKREANRRGVTRIELDVWTFNHEARQAFANLGFRSAMERMVLSGEEPNQAVETAAPVAQP